MSRIFVYEHLTAQGASTMGATPLAPSLLAEGQAMRDAVMEDFRRIADVEVLLPHEPDTEENFRRLATQADYSLVIAPETAEILETRCRWVEESGGRLLGPSSIGVQLATDKLALARHWAMCGVPTPPSVPLSLADTVYPQMWKPRDGAGSQLTFAVRDAVEAETVRRFLRENGHSFEEFIAQPLLQGTAVSVALLIGPHTIVALEPCYQLLSADGRFHYLGGSLPIASELRLRAKELATQCAKTMPGLRGYVGVDLLLGRNAEEDSVIELNPRLTTSYVGLRKAATFNLASAMQNVAIGHPIREWGWRSTQITFRPDGTAEEE